MYSKTRKEGTDIIDNKYNDVEAKRSFAPTYDTQRAHVVCNALLKHLYHNKKRIICIVKRERKEQI